MSKLLGMCFDMPASPSLTVLYTRKDRLERSRPYGLGVAWYADPDPAAIVVKDPTSVSDNATSQILRDWTRFRSTLFVSHLRGAAASVSQASTQPFQRSYAGRDWVMAHHGPLQAEFRSALPLEQPPLFEPVGVTDSEHVLCWLLERCRSVAARTLADVGWERLATWLAEINVHGRLDLLLSDGDHLVCYQDNQQSWDSGVPLRWCRRVPPHGHPVLTNDDVELDLLSAGDQSRSVVMFSTDELRGVSGDPNDDDIEWLEMAPGQLLVARRGAIIWNSHPHLVPQPRPPAAAATPPSALANPAVGPGQSPAATGTTTAMQQGNDQGRPNDQTGIRQATTGERGEVRVFDVTHMTRYVYSAPIERSHHTFRLRPVQDRHQELLSHSLEITPDGARRDHEDVFGNFATELDLQNPFSEKVVVARSRVRITPIPPGAIYSPSQRTALPMSWMPWQRQMMQPYLLSIELPESQLQELFDYAMSFVERQAYDVVATLSDINSTIYRDYAYTQGSTSLETTPYEVYTARHGVCQDFANLMICLARLLNVPARYRVGYIHTGASYENKLQSEASHAWVELFLPWIGWFGFDPTNGHLVGGDHIRVACGRHYRDATPTSGTIYKGGGDETMTIEVRVEEVQNPDG